MKVDWITDVNKPGTYPEGGWWFVRSGTVGDGISPLLETEHEARAWMEGEQSKAQDFTVT